MIILLLDIKGDTVLKIKLEEPVRTPYNLQSVLAHDPKTGVNDASLVWNEETDYFFDDFENYTSFTLDFAPWTGIDKDQAEAAMLMQGGYPNSSFETICDYYCSRRSLCLYYGR